jgi:hypothetical protein
MRAEPVEAKLRAQLELSWRPFDKLRAHLELSAAVGPAQNCITS